MRPPLEAMSHAPRAVYPQNAPSLRGYLASPEGRVPSSCARPSELSRRRFGSRTLKCAPAQELSHTLRGSCTRKLRPDAGAISHSPRVARTRIAAPFRSYLAFSEGRAPRQCGGRLARGCIIKVRRWRGAFRKCWRRGGEEIETFCRWRGGPQRLTGTRDRGLVVGLGASC